MSFKLNPNSLPFPTQKPISPSTSDTSPDSSSSPTNSSSKFSYTEAAGTASSLKSSITTSSIGTGASDCSAQTPISASTSTSTSHNGFPYSVVFPSSYTSADANNNSNDTPLGTKTTAPRSFGQGWLSSSTRSQSYSNPITPSSNLTPSVNDALSLPTQHLLPIGHGGRLDTPTRTRSPSMPITFNEARQAGFDGSTYPPFLHSTIPATPTHAQPYHPQNQFQQNDLMSSFAQLGLSRFSPANHHPHHPAYSFRGSGDLTPGLTHYPSVPSLSSGSSFAYHGNTEGMGKPNFGRRASGPVVRWLDEVELGKSAEEESADYERRSQLERSRLGSKSMSVLQTPVSGRNVYIPQIDAGTNKEALKSYAQTFGQVLSLRFDQNASNPSAGSRAFVLFGRAEDAVNFMNALIHQGIACEYGKEDWQTYYKSLEDPNSSNLYIQGFLPNDSEDFVKEVLRPGVVSSAKWLTDDQGRLRGTILARLQSRAQADEVIELLDQKFVHPVSGEKLQVRIADSESQKQWKRQMKVLEHEQHSADRRGSMPAAFSNEYQDRDDDYELEQERLQYLQKARLLEERLAAKRSSMNLRSQVMGSFPGTPRTPISSPLGQDYRIRHNSSSYFGPEVVTPTYIDKASWSSRQGWEADFNPTFGMSPHERFDRAQFEYGLKSHQGQLLTPSQGLYHTRSSPELRRIENPAKLLWPGDDE